MALNALAYGTLVLYALILASLLEKLAAVRAATTVSASGVVHIYTDTGYRGMGAEENAQAPTAY